MTEDGSQLTEIAGHCLVVDGPRPSGVATATRNPCGTCDASTDRLDERDSTENRDRPRQDRR